MPGLLQKSPNYDQFPEETLPEFSPVGGVRLLKELVQIVAQALSEAG